MYKVVKDFTDLQDNNHVYLAGDEYPRKGAKPDEKRIDELGSKFNKRGEVLIEAVEEKPKMPQKADILPEEDEILPKEEKPKKEKKSASKGKSKE